MLNKRILKGIIVVIICLFLTTTIYAETEVYFSHVDDIQAVIVLTINAAEESIDVTMYTFTDLILANALSDAKDRGVVIRIYLDRSQVTAKYSQSRYFIQNNMNVRISSNHYIMHNKFAIIDGKLLITGSYNWTESANTRNDENLIIIKCPYAIEIYQEQFERLWDQYSPTLFEKLFKRAKEEVG